MIQTMALVFVGGGLGSLCRWLVAIYCKNHWQIGLFPLGTLLVNLVGSFVIGLLLAEHTHTSLRQFLVLGFCGGFTTFSTLSAESYELFRLGHYSTVALYVGLSILGGLACVACGFMLRTYLLKI